jgi:uncharacterized phage-associated protein
MPAWSPEIANEFIRLATRDDRTLDQLQLQGLVYIAHGWCLAMYGEPLTGDRPEAREYGPMYTRLAAALEAYGQGPVPDEAPEARMSPQTGAISSSLEQVETDLIWKIYQTYGAFESWQLSALTRKGDTPWKRVFADGAGKSRDIPHGLIRTQFVELLRQSEGSE